MQQPLCSGISLSKPGAMLWIAGAGRRAHAAQTHSQELPSCTRNHGRDEVMPPRLWLTRKGSWLSTFWGFRRRSGTVSADPPHGRRRSRKRSTRTYFPPRAPSSSRKPSSSCNLPWSFVSSCTQKEPKCWPRYRNRACCLHLPTGLDENSGYCSLKGSSESCN